MATRDLEPLELIIKDEPAIFGPNHDTGDPDFKLIYCTTSFKALSSISMSL